jgi:hypothetical protein
MQPIHPFRREFIDIPHSSVWACGQRSWEQTAHYFSTRYGGMMVVNDHFADDFGGK